jgi:hypothetical protein
MKKILFWLFMIPALSINAQFTLKPEGFVSSTDTTKQYVVFDYDSISQADLYKTVLLFINTTYKSPKDVLNEIPNETITLHGVQPNIIGIPRKSSVDRKVLGKYGAMYDIAYTVTVKFKDNKIRFDAPIFECSRFMKGGAKARLTLAGKVGALSANHRVFNPQNGKVEDEDVKNQIENFFNSLCIMIKTSILINKRENEEW